MQMLTPIASDEKLLVSGRYEYFLNYQPANVVEHFTVHRLPDDRTITRVERDASGFGIQILLEAVTDKNQIERFETHFFNRKNEAFPNVRAVYQFDRSNVCFKRFFGETIETEETFRLPDGCVVFPLMRIFQADVILKVAASERPVSVLVPAIENPLDRENLLRPTFDGRTAERIGEEGFGVQIEDSMFAQDATVYRYVSNRYDENARFWINADNLLIGYQFQPAQNKIWNVTLILDEWLEIIKSGA